MTEIAIQANDIGKVFRIYDRPSDRLREAFSYRGKKYYTDYPALKNISFTVKKGEFLGIVGKNGAGKSTLLKILSGELTPSAGSVTINGNVSLLQLGVGFDPELTGIENARFASKLLGYRDDEIEGMLEEIIAFADIGDFIHHPVKTYSSGMYSRLSFAVGVNINPDILIADEVLAVGDMRFSQKCLRKMREFKEKGKTIVLVTHDVTTVNVFCDTAIWLKDGALFQSGDAKAVAANYTNYMLYDKLPDEYNSSAGAVGSDFEINDDRNAASVRSNNYETVEWDDISNSPCIGDGGAKITGVALYLKKPFEKKAVFEGTEYIYLFIKVKIDTSIQKPHFGFVLYDRHGLPAIHTNSDLCGGNLGALFRGQEAVVCFEIKLPGLSNGNYIFAISAEEGQTMRARVHDVLPIQVTRPGPQGTQCGHVIIEEQRVEMGAIQSR